MPNRKVKSLERSSFIDTESAMSICVVKFKVRSHECAFFILNQLQILYSGWWRQWVSRWNTPTRLHDLINWRIKMTSPAEVWSLHIDEKSYLN